MINDATPSVAVTAQTDSFYRDVGSRIRAARDHKGLSQEKVALGVGLSRTSLTNIERGKQKFLLHTFVGIAAALDVPITDLLPAPGSSSIKMSLKFPPDLEPASRDFVERALNSIIQHEPKSQEHHLSQSKRLARTPKSSRASGRR